MQDRWKKVRKKISELTGTDEEEIAKKYTESSKDTLKQRCFVESTVLSNTLNEILLVNGKHDYEVTMATVIDQMVTQNLTLEGRKWFLSRVLENLDKTDVISRMCRDDKDEQ